jgi:crotonobetainyl-CoA:carnitine CoA-transferase CaiB-like acyl-CoA transferase
MYLGFLGATVVKVESRAYPDLTRRSSPDLHGSPSFHLANLGKRSVEVDLDTGEGRELFLALCDAADVVITNIQPESLARKGAGYAQCSARNPGLVWAQISTSGTTGPERHYQGYAPSFNALSGLSSLSGYDDGPPAEMRSAGDMRVAYDLVLCCLAALHMRRRTGAGTFIDLSCREVLTARCGDVLLGTQMDGSAVRAGNGQTGVCPRGVCPCRDDGWLAIEVTTDEEWKRFAVLVPSLVGRRDLEGAIARWQTRAEVDDLIAAWTRPQGTHDAAAALQEAGIAAAPSMSNTELASLPHLWQRGFFLDMGGDAQGGPEKLVATPWGSPANVWPSLAAALAGRPRGAPRLGQDTEEVFSELGRAAE